MADLFIRELLMRARRQAVLIVALAAWSSSGRTEMFEKFGLSFSLFSREPSSSRAALTLTTSICWSPVSIQLAA